MRSVTLAFVLCLARLAWAQQVGTAEGEKAPASDVPTVTPATAPLRTTPCLAAPTLLPQASRDCAPAAPAMTWLRVGRLALEVVMGTVLAAPLEVGGAYIGLLFDVQAGHEASLGSSLGTAIGAILGVAPSVWLAGYLMGGDGELGWSFLGAAVGTGLSAGVLAIRSNTTTLAIAAALPVLGAIVTYELSSHEHRPEKKPETRTAAFTVVPVVGPASVGVVGTF